MRGRQRQMEGTGAISAIGIGSVNQSESVRPRVGGALHDLVVILIFFKGDDGQGCVGDRVVNAELQGRQTPGVVSKSENSNTITTCHNDDSKDTHKELRSKRYK